MSSLLPRIAQPVLRSGLRSVPRICSWLAPRASNVLSTAARAAAPAARSFSSSTDKSMISILKRELQEEQPDVAPEIPDGFKLSDVPGSTRITMTKTIGKETIIVEFEVEPPKPEEDEFMDEENPEEQENGENEDWNPDLVDFKVHIVKSGAAESPCLSFECMTTGLEEEPWTVRTVRFFSNSKHAVESTADGEWNRLGQYMGPSLQQLPEDMHENLVGVLTSRGVDTELVDFITAYVIYKEQNEYVSWLKNVRKFLEA